MTDIIMRKALLTDASAIGSLAREFASENPSSSPSAAIDLEKNQEFIPSIIKSPALFVAVAEVHNLVVGLVAFSQIPSLVHGGRVTTLIDLLVVMPQHRRQGIGTRLIEYVLESSRQANAYKVLLITREDNVAARALYRRCSFVINGIGFANYFSPDELRRGSP